MEDDYYDFKYWDELEEDFINKTTNIYAKINDNYYMKVKYMLTEEVSMIEGVFSFCFCRITKIREHVFKETRISKRYLVSEKTMLASEFIENNLTNNDLYEIIEDELYERGDFYICANSYKDDDGNICKIIQPVNKNDSLIKKPKTLKLLN